MSISTITQSSPLVCGRPNFSIHPHERLHPPPRFQLDWNRVAGASIIAAVATSVSQFVSAPLDVATRIIRDSPTATSRGTIRTLIQVIQKKGPLAAFSGLPLHLMKRCPTKALTVALFEIGTQALTSRKCIDNTSIESKKLNPSQHITVALVSGAIALLATYPTHISYYAIRKGVFFSQIVRSVRTRPPILYSGAIPAVMATAPAVMVDYMVYRSLREQIDKNNIEQPRSQLLNASAIIAAAATSNLMGGFVSEPFKALSRKMAVESIKSVSCKSLTVSAKTILRGGVGEFWRGFPRRSPRYALSAVVSKATVQRLQTRGKNIRLRSPLTTGDSNGDIIPAAMHLPAYVPSMSIQCMNNGQRKCHFVTHF